VSVADTRLAKRLCWERCSFTEQCLELALSISPYPEGIWGGTTYRERALIRRRRRAEVA
jgi:hypothetical protein